MKRLFTVLVLTLSLLSGFVSPVSAATALPTKIDDLVAKGPLVDVRAFGAIPNDAIDDTTAIDKALKYGAAQKRDVYAGGGVYLINAHTARLGGVKYGIVIPANTTLYLSADTTLQAITNGSTIYAIVYFSETSINSALVGGTVRGDRQTHDYAAVGTHEFGHCARTYQAQNVTINGTALVDGTGDGLEISGTNTGGVFLPSKKIVVKNSRIERNRRNGISVVVCVGFDISNNKINDTGINDGFHDGTAPKTGIDVEGGSFPSYGTIANNQFNGNVVGDVWLYKGAFITVSGNVGDGDTGFQESSHCTFVGNVARSIVKTSGTAIPYINTAGTMLGVGITYEIITRVTLDYTTVGAADNNVGTRFTCTTALPLGTGDSVYRISRDIVIANNLLQYISVTYGPENIKITGNNLIGSSSIGIIINGTNYTIENNYINDRTTAGIRMTGGSGVISGNVTNTIIEYTAGNYIVKDNIISGSISISKGTISGNIVDLSWMTAQGTGGAIMTGTGTDIVNITDNIIIGLFSTRGAIWARSPSRIIGNHIIGNRTALGIHLSAVNASGTLVEDNVIDMAITGNGINVAATTKATLLKNSISSAVALTNAIDTSTATGSTVKGNVAESGAYLTAGGDVVAGNL